MSGRKRADQLRKRKYALVYGRKRGEFMGHLGYGGDGDENDGEDGGFIAECFRVPAMGQFHFCKQEMTTGPRDFFWPACQ
jgi:hypothetical protein